jgi:hypothetical protein
VAACDVAVVLFKAALPSFAVYLFNANPSPLSILKKTQLVAGTEGRSGFRFGNPVAKMGAIVVAPAAGLAPD